MIELGCTTGELSGVKFDGNLNLGMRDGDCGAGRNHLWIIYIYIYIIDNVKKIMAARAWPNMFPCRNLSDSKALNPEVPKNWLPLLTDQRNCKS
jgi:hypothetical protein